MRGSETKQALHWPEAVLSYVVVALALGFPAVVALAWIFDVNAGRIERTGPAAPATGLRGGRLAVLLVGHPACCRLPVQTVMGIVIRGGEMKTNRGWAIVFACLMLGSVHCGSRKKEAAPAPAGLALPSAAQPPLPPVNHVLEISRAGTGSGRVTSVTGIDCGLTCSPQFESGTTVELSAVADPGSTFAGWSGACSGTAGCSIAMANDASVVATFDAVPKPEDECARLQHAEPGPAPRKATYLFSKSTGVEYCGAGYVAGSGTLALPTEDSSPGYGTTLHFALKTGESLGARGGPRTDTLTEQLNGFVIQNSAGGGQSWLTATDSSGGRLAEAHGHISDLCEDPTGGGVALQSGSLVSYDAELRLRFSLPLPPKSAPLAVDRAGNTLVLSDGSQQYGSGSIAAFWVDHAGAMGAVFMLIGPTSSIVQSPQATARVKSGLFIASGGRWTLQLDSLSTRSEPAPAWLASRPVREMHMVHDGRAYAILPPAAHPAVVGDCVQSIEVVASSGKSCGTNTFRAAAGSCETLGIRVGYDGTVVQQLPSASEFSCPATGSQCACTWQWWPGFFQ